jgi:hypothetical protein
LLAPESEQGPVCARTLEVENANKEANSKV